jgi:hypothetical protein
MLTNKTLHALPLAILLSLPVAANARTINLFETGDGHQVVPENANPMAAEKAAFAELATMTIQDLVEMEINGKPLTVQVHVPAEDGNGQGYEVVTFTAEYPEGVTIPGGETPGVATPSVSEVPLPAAAWLMGSGLLGMTMVARRRSADGSLSSVA